MFPNFLKLADVTPIHKKGMKELKEEYRSVSIIPTLSKMFERTMFVKISASFDNVFSKYQCTFQKGYSLQFENVRKMEKCVGKGKDFVSLLTDLSKAFDFLGHTLLIYKLTALIFQHDV